MAFLRLFHGAAGRSQSVYTIDFVGPPAAVVTNTPSAPAGGAKPEIQAPSSPSKPPPRTDFDEFGRRRRRRNSFVLPRPSLLRGFKEKPRTETQTPQNITASPEAPAASPIATGAGQAGVATDMPNFPYPWYISQVRQGLWNQWSSRMPQEKGECVVVFSLLPNGSLVDLRTEVSSGDVAFDLTALSVVQDASPFAPLPQGFKEPFLKIHVTLKN